MDAAERGAANRARLHLKQGCGGGRDRSEFKNKNNNKNKNFAWLCSRSSEFTLHHTHKNENLTLLRGVPLSRHFYG